MVQRHRASRLHYDLRLEVDGVLVSWAVPRGPTLDPDERRMAMRTEDHPIEYLDFEAVDPRRRVRRGRHDRVGLGHLRRRRRPMTPAAALRAGELKLQLDGERLRGRFTIVQTGGQTRCLRADAESAGQWLLIHKRDEAAVAGWDPEAHAAEREDRAHQRRGGCRRRRRASRPPPPSAGTRAGPLGRAPGTDARLHPADAGHDAGGSPSTTPTGCFEVKWDGYRVEAVLRDGRVRLWTRNRVDAATYFPDLAGPAPTGSTAREAVVDGEVVALDPEVAPTSPLLQDRTGLRGPRGRGPAVAGTGAAAAASRRRARRDPARLQVFDLLYLDGSSLLDVPLEERKRLLRRVLRPHPVVRYASHVVGEGEAFVRAAAERRAGGDRRQAARQPLRAWEAVARLAEDQGCAASRSWSSSGWLPGQGSHADLGSLIVAVNGRWPLRHAGQVGSGISDAMRRQLLGGASSRWSARPRRARSGASPRPTRTGWSRGS